MSAHELFDAPYDDPLGIGFVATCPPSQIAGNTAVSTANRTQYIRLLSGGKVSSFVCRVATSGGNISVALYKNTGTGKDAKPGARIATTGSVALPAAAVSVSIPLGSTVQVSRGDWLGFSFDSALPVLYHAGAMGGAGPTDGWAWFEDVYPCPAVPGVLTAGLMRHYAFLGRP